MLETLPKRSERHKKERRRGLAILLTLVILGGGSAAAGGLWWFWATGSGGTRARIVFEIPAGASGADVADLLQAQGVIRSARAFKLLARFRGLEGGFEAGTYTNLTTNMSPEEAIAQLKKGPLPKKTISALFPEGLNVAQTADRVQDQLGVRRQDFLKTATSGTLSLPPYLPKNAATVEGFLFPKKYDFPADVDAAGVIQRLFDQFKDETKDLPWSNYKKLDLKNRYQVVIVASMIEREAKFDEDRGKIARVIHNRLRKGMPLQIDATVQYALNKYAPLQQGDFQVESPYNTYLHQGLPPTPIASPGLASIEAALNPTAGPWIYYVVIDAQGHHGFTDSYNEFLKLRAQYTG